MYNAVCLLNSNVLLYKVVILCLGWVIEEKHLKYTKQLPKKEKLENTLQHKVHDETFLYAA